jgi:2-succinyl-6-hydroxy-2,4-cyclohexadiene-1-carboxylate synthase
MLVFLHGFLGSAADWDPIMNRLHDRICLAYNLPGHGGNPWTSEELTFPEQPFHLIGYSLGGRLAMRFALQYPERVLSLALLSAHYGLTTPEEKAQRLHADRIWADKLRMLPFDQFLQEWYTQKVFSSHMMRTTQPPEPLAQALLFWSLAHQPCYREQLRSFSKPLRILYGARDTKFKALYQDWPQGVEIPHVGHGLLFESPNEVYDQLATIW